MENINSTDIVTLTKNKISKWEKPGGTTGMICLGLITGAVLINITTIMNFIAAACASTFSAIGMGAALFSYIYSST